MAYSKGYDKTLFLVGTHTVMYDKYQLVLKHPLGCPRRGSGKDQGKTFHRLEAFMERAADCGLTFTSEQGTMLIGIGHACAEAVR